MLTEIVIFGKTIPMYGLCWFLGIFIAAIVAVLIKRKRNIDTFDLVCSAVYSMIGAALGAKILFIIVSMPVIISWFEAGYPVLSIIEAVMRGGFVFYGGLIGGAAGLFLYTFQFKLKLKEFVDVYAVVLPLGHAVGRVGCHLAGCCYGIEYDGPFSVVYEHATEGSTPVGVPLFPVQLAEATALLLLFFVLLTVYLCTKKRLVPSVTYAMGYAVIRFTLEFFRGDAERGVLLGISTSQWISLALAVAAAVILVLLLKRREPSEDGKRLKIGFCTIKPSLFSELAALGYDYVEGSLMKIYSATDEELKEISDALSAAGIPMETTNGFFPGEITLYYTDKAEAESTLKGLADYAERALSRASALGVKLSVIGAGTSRRIPEGMDMAEAVSQLDTVMNMLADIAAKYGIKVVIEPLNKGETNVINSLSEAYAMAKRINNPNLGVLNDFYHADKENQPLEELTEAKDLLFHLHVCGRHRLPLSPGLRDWILPQMDLVKANGYVGRISIESGKPTPIESMNISYPLLSEIKDRFNAD